MNYEKVLSVVIILIVESHSLLTKTKIGL